MIQVVVVAQSVVVRAGLEAVIATQPALRVLASGSVLAPLLDLHPDVVLLDLDPEDDLPPFTQSPAWVLLTEEPDSAWVLKVLRAGVRGVLARGASAMEITGAVLAAASGLVVLQAELLDLLPLLPERPTLVSALSPREGEVLTMLAEGLGNKTIARRLNISEHTVKFHVASLFTKLNASSRTEAVTLGARLGLILL
ncbi:response regulator transcription factor [Candidatus Cyanaurora vandensis]|uniref:response regulator transcription factor n=1 Tax=Candidatus Cyanaurora vandensis TaxID=2714958 RepID=UPI00257AC1FC|nr:response regulator transcription factor [Candidatus Cyanaurora vandensis]